MTLSYYDASGQKLIALAPNPVLSKFKTGDEVKTTDTTFADDADLKNYALVANTDYTIYGMLFVDAASTTPSVKFQWSGPAGATLKAWMEWGRISAANDNRFIFTSISATAAIALGGNTDLEAISVWGVVRCATAGNFSLQWAQNTSSADHTTIAAFSYLTLTPIK